MSDNQRESLLRKARFEIFEDRLVLSAQPLGDFHVDELLSVPIEHQYSQIAPTLADAHQQTGVSYARNAFGVDGSGQTVAIIDSGIAYDHYALGGGLGTGYRVVGGWDFTEENDANPYDDGPAGFHGTHVAGIIGSSNSQYSGVAPGVDLVALRVFNDQGAGYFHWVETALQWVHDHRNTFRNPITTVNLSLGTNWNSDNPPAWAMLEDEFAQLKADGIFISVAAGNSFQSFKTPGLNYPAASPYVVPVASVGDSGQLSSFSQRNSRVIAAPGERITSTVPDHIFGGDGVPNDFATASGTSMAAPYVAGASTLLREAMDLLGYQNVTQDSLYNVFRSTADSVYDSITQASYFRLNVQRAIDSIMPSDDYGSTTATAHALGTLSGDESFSGLIGRLDDLDFFRFTAGETGKIQFTAAAHGKLTPNWQLIGGGGSIDGAKLSFEVVAGQSYTIGLGTGGGIGFYDVKVQLDSASSIVDWGTIVGQQSNRQKLSGDEAWFQLKAGRSGVLTVDALPAQSSGAVTLELYDGNNKLLAASRNDNGRQRLDVSATSGQTLYLRVRGTKGDVDFRLTNMVTVSGNRVNVFGTSGNDMFSFVAGTSHQITVNAVNYTFAGSSVSLVVFQGGAGHDAIKLTGTDGSELAVMRPGSVDLAGRTFMAQASGVETIDVAGGEGLDTARMYDSAGDDLLVTHPDSSTLSGSGFSNSVTGFQRVYAYATAGGNDTARMHDSADSDQFYGRADFSLLRGSDFYNVASGFDRVLAYSNTGAGSDTAWLYDSEGNDRLDFHADHSVLRGVGFYNEASGFDRVYAFATRGGNDQAWIHDTAGNQFISRPGYCLVWGPGFYNYAFGFQSVYTSSVASGLTSASLNGLPGEQTPTAGPAASQFRGATLNTADAHFSVRTDVRNDIEHAVFRDVGNGDMFYIRRGHVDLHSTESNHIDRDIDFDNVRRQRDDRIETGLEALDNIFEQVGR